MKRAYYKDFASAWYMRKTHGIDIAVQAPVGEGYTYFSIMETYEIPYLLHSISNFYVREESLELLKPQVGDLIHMPLAREKTFMYLLRKWILNNEQGYFSFTKDGLEETDYIVLNIKDVNGIIQRNDKAWIEPEWEE